MLDCRRGFLERGRCEDLGRGLLENLGRWRKLVGGVNLMDLPT